MMCCGGCSLAARPFVVTPQKACCFFVVRSVATMWACYAWLWLGIICGVCCESANRLYASPLVQTCMFPVLALQLHPHGFCPVPHPLHRPDGRASMPVSFPEGMVLCMQGRESRILPCHVCQSMRLLLCPLCCCHKGRACRWAGRVLDVDDVSLCPTFIFPACCSWVLVPVACVLESQTLQNTWARQVADEARGFLRFAPSSQVVW